MERGSAMMRAPASGAKMFGFSGISSSRMRGFGLALTLVIPLGGADAKDFRVLYTFTGASGSVPYGALIADKFGEPS